ncbi:hypothetical protein HYX11_02635 [Candidatus Woesearchaeota archaeon]|nr:hypothetical protein [Candidatus Woesearchaeota archaeon]
MAVNDLKKLSPEERIKKLKELEEQKKKEIEQQKKDIEQDKKEIEDAEKEIKNAQEELNEKRKVKEKVPIPEFAKEDLEGLSEEGKQILSAQKGIKKEVFSENEENKQSGKNISREEISLEETLSKEKVELQQMQVKYELQLSHKPMQDLYSEMVNIYKRAEEKGYVSQEEERRVHYLSSAVEQKLEAVEEGSYSLSQELERTVSTVKQLSEGLRGMYKSHRREQDLYR